MSKVLNLCITLGFQSIKNRTVHLADMPRNPVDKRESGTFSCKNTPSVHTDNLVVQERGAQQLFPSFFLAGVPALKLGEMKRE